MLALAILDIAAWEPARSWLLIYVATKSAFAGWALAMRDTFGSACHGAGRLMSRKAAIRGAHGRNIIRELADKGIVIKARDRQTIAEEMPDAYKDVSDVVEVCDAAGIATRVARIVPLGCIKG